MDSEPIDVTKPGPLLTPDEMARMFRLPSRRAVYAHVSRGQLPPPIRVGTTCRWKREHVRDWLDDEVKGPRVIVVRKVQSQGPTTFGGAA